MDRNNTKRLLGPRPDGLRPSSNKKKQHLLYIPIPSLITMPFWMYSCHNHNILDNVERSDTLRHYHGEKEVAIVEETSSRIADHAPGPSPECGTLRRRWLHVMGSGYPVPSTVFRELRPVDSRTA